VLFNSPLYGAFLIGAFVIFWLIREHRLARALFLVAISYAFYFYGTWDAAKAQGPRFLGPLGPIGWSVLCLSIIFVGSSLDYWIGRALGRVEHTTARKALLLASIVYYLGVLSVFKYWNFAADSFAVLLAAAGVHVHPTHLRLVLPFGISFFTFETMSYTIDVYRREFPPAKRYLDYLLFVCFFPHLVAGPIVRPRFMLPQLEKTPIADADDQARGLFRIAMGLAKKLMIGDFLSTNLVGRVFDNPERYSSVEVVVAVYAYAVQIYCDFSGYTDVAIGSAQLFGYALPPNFDAPYTAHNLQDFWRRWHISLSTWLRDYLYIPLGGSRGGPWKTYRNLMITMLLGGLWHGASWNFVIWGGIHGIVLAATRMWQRRVAGSERRRNEDSPEAEPRGIRRLFGVFSTFHVVCFAWIFFRAPTLEHAMLAIGRILRFTTSATNLSPRVLAVLAIGLATHFAPNTWLERLRDGFVRRPAVVQGALLALAAYALHAAASARTEPFVYGQF
jgi:D-alanyl-lipoteichoic acid acyltransferase DltB (MBOAT superfamily)